MKTIGQRLKHARKLARITQKQLAEASGVSQQMISKLESGKSQETTGVPGLARVLNCDLYWLYDGSGTPPNDPTNPDSPADQASPNVIDIAIPTRQLFVISTIQAGRMCECPDIYHPGDGEEQIVTSAQVGPRAYALRVEGDSMTNPHGAPSIPDGSIVIIDPDIEAIPGRIVVAKIKGEDEATLKKLVKDGPRYYLKPLNPAYPMIEVDDRFIICGVAKKVELDLL